MKRAQSNRESDMKEATRRTLARIMSSAWVLARLGARQYGGNPRLYFVCALRLIWADWRNGKKNARPATCWVSGIGNLYLLPGITLPQRVQRGQCCLPGISK